MLGLVRSSGSSAALCAVVAVAGCQVLTGIDGYELGGQGGSGTVTTTTTTTNVGAGGPGGSGGSGGGSIAAPAVVYRYAGDSPSGSSRALCAGVGTGITLGGYTRGTSATAPGVTAAMADRRRGVAIDVTDAANATFSAFPLLTDDGVVTAVTRTGSPRAAGVVGDGVTPASLFIEDGAVTQRFEVFGPTPATADTTTEGVVALHDLGGDEVIMAATFMGPIDLDGMADLGPGPRGVIARINLSGAMPTIVWRRYLRTTDGSNGQIRVLDMAVEGDTAFVVGDFREGDYIVSPDPTGMTGPTMSNAESGLNDDGFILQVNLVSGNTIANPQAAVGRQSFTEVEVAGSSLYVGGDFNGKLVLLPIERADSMGNEHAFVARIDLLQFAVDGLAVFGGGNHDMAGMGSSQGRVHAALNCAGAVSVAIEEGPTTDLGAGADGICFASLEAGANLDLASYGRYTAADLTATDVYAESPTRVVVSGWFRGEWDLPPEGTTNSIGEALFGLVLDPSDPMQ